MKRNILILLTITLFLNSCKTTTNTVPHDNYTNDGLKLIDILTGQVIRTFSGHSDGVWSVNFNADWSQMISIDNNNLIIWDISSCQKINTFSAKTGEQFLSASFSPDGKQIAASGGNTLTLWDKSTGNIVRTFSGRTGGWFSNINFNPDGKHIIVFEEYFSQNFSPDGKLIGLTNKGDTILWDISTGNVIRTFSGFNTATSLSISPDGKYLFLINSDNNTILLWDIFSGQLIRTFSGHTEHISLASFNHDGSRILSKSLRNNFKLWDILTGQEILSITHSGHIYLMDFSSDENKIVSSGGVYPGSNIILWDVSTGKKTYTFSGSAAEDYYNGFSFSSDGRYIVSRINADYLRHSSDKNDEIKLWDISTGKEVRSFSLTENTSSVTRTSAIISPCGTKILLYKTFVAL